MFFNCFYFSFGFRSIQIDLDLFHFILGPGGGGPEPPKTHLLEEEWVKNPVATLKPDRTGHT